MAKSITLSEQGITYIGGHTTAGQARNGIMFSDGCLKDVAKNNSVSKRAANVDMLHPSISSNAQINYIWAELHIDYAGG
jgi:hypothetical protein